MFLFKVWTWSDVLAGEGHLRSLIVMAIESAMRLPISPS